MTKLTGWKEADMNNRQVFNYPLFAMGFRFFFLLAALSGLALIALWSSIYRGELHAQNYFPVTYWHAHEMLLGYTVAVIAGFLLTAVKNWTGIAPVTADQIAGLGLLWLYGRILPFYAGLVPNELIALVDWVFMPLLLFFVVRPMIKKAYYRGLVFPLLLLLLTFANGLIHAELLALTENTAMSGMNILVAIIVLMILVIAGRIFPFFTERGLKGVIAIRNPLLDSLAIGASLLFFVCMVTNAGAFWVMITALFAIGLNLLRAWGWFDSRVWYVPLLWVLYLGYAWLILGFVLAALSAYSVVNYSLALHAFTVGGIGVLTLGMMARVSLGHTGRALRASNTIAIAFAFINLAAFFRVVVPGLLPSWYGVMVGVSTYCWLAAFSLFAVYYLPILLAPRIDGAAG
jgi:uncharacterized protein involved in response to NO